MLGVISGQDSPLNEPWGGAELEPKAVVAGGLPADFHLFEGGRRLRQLLGGDQNEIPDAYREASPITHVHDGAPPFFLFHGTWDTLVPIEHAEDFAQALRDKDVEVQLYRQWLRGHVLSFSVLTVRRLTRRWCFLTASLGMGEVSAGGSSGVASGRHSVRRPSACFI
jgi:Dipeptidyl aminopeptidases/acylaminoacyl-peptidases